MWVLKKHIGAFKGNKTDTAEGVCQQTGHGRNKMYLLFMYMKENSTPSSYISYRENFAFACICNSEINMQHLFTKEFTI